MWQKQRKIKDSLLYHFTSIFFFSNHKNFTLQEMLYSLPVSIISLSLGMEHMTSILSCVFSELER